MESKIERYSTEALIRSMSNINTVLKSFELSYKDEKVDEKGDAAPPHLRDDAQEKFAVIINSIIYNEDGTEAKFHPTNRYIKKLLQKYVSQVEQYSTIENETFLEIMIEYQFRTTEGGEIPNPCASCHISFEIPQYGDEHIVTENLVGTRVYPQNNDVGVRKLWEAGACLTEYLIRNPELVDGKTIVELGAGVGTTGIIVAGLCKTKSVHMTDYTDATLLNMIHNVTINKEWTKRVRESLNVEEEIEQPVTTGYLEWEQFADGEFDSQSHIMRKETIDQDVETSLALARQAQVLIAADCVYDRKFIPALVQSVAKLLSNEEKCAIFATTFRNAETFEIFEKELQRVDVRCEYVAREDIADLPYIFPCYDDQPRSDVRICIMRKK